MNIISENPLNIYNTTDLNTTNDKTCAVQYDQSLQIVTIINIFIATLGIISNVAFLLVTINISSIRRMTTNHYLISLSVADIIYLTISSIINFLIVFCKSSPQDTPFKCSLVSILLYLPFYVSEITIAVVSMERYKAVCWALDRKTPAAQSRIACVTISISWIIGTGLTIPHVISCNLGLSQRVAKINQKIGIIVHTIPFFISFGFVVILYTLIAQFLLKRADNVSAALRKTVKTNSQQITKMLIITGLVFFFSCLPTQIDYIITAFNYYGITQINVNENLMFGLTRILLSLNSAINPIIYNMASSEYRRAFKQTFACCSKILFRIKSKDLQGVLSETETIIKRTNGENSIDRTQASRLHSMNSDLKNNSFVKMAGDETVKEELINLDKIKMLETDV